MLLAGTAAVPIRADTAVAGQGNPAGLTANPDIVVTASALFRDIQPERSLDEGGIASYGDSTVDELLSDVQAEVGEDGEPPLILVNGERVNDADSIGALPVEVLRSVQLLPRGSAVRIGGTSGQRVISLTVRQKVRSATLTAAPKISTEGGYHGERGEAILTSLHGATRANLALRVRDDSALLESDRNIVQPASSLPYALGGNVVGYPNPFGEINPLLSAAAGDLVSVAPLPGGGDPTLTDFIANANQPAATNLGRFRTLRPSSRNYDLNGSYATRLAPWLTGSASVHLSRTLITSKRGLPTALFTLYPDNPSSPFSTPVGLAFYIQRVLRSRSRRDSADVNLTLDAHLGQWISNFNARHSESKDNSRFERQALFGSIPLNNSVDPFTADLAGLIPIATNRAKAHSITNFVQLSASGPAAKLPAGDVQATLEARFVDNRLRSSSDFSIVSADNGMRRSEESFRGAVDVPLTSRDNGFLPELGALSATAEYSRVHYSDVGTLNHHALGLIWEPRPLLRLTAQVEQAAQPPSIQLLGNPVIVTPVVRVFDPLTAQTVDVVQISGGNPSLLPETTRIRRVAALLRLVPRLNLQIDGEYTDTDVRHFISSLPDASAAVTLAFPDRFIRNSNGVLTSIDYRPVNFGSHREKRFRYGLSFNMTLGGGGRPTAPAMGYRPPTRGPSPPKRLQLTLNHTIVFSDSITIRPGLDPINLLEGGAIGIAGGRVRHQLDGTASITSGGLGIRLGVNWRGASTLESRFGATTEELRFSPVFQFNLRAFADARQLFGRSSWSKGMRLSLNVLNATDGRQRVRDAAGLTPLLYQPAYRDPIGRTVEIEIRKVF